MSDFKQYLFSYSHDGAEWGFEVSAQSREDAMERVKRIGWARYEGEVFATVPAELGALAKLFVWARNKLFK